MGKSEVKFSDQKPPNWSLLMDNFVVDWNYTVVTYGNTIHSKFPLPPDVQVHEFVHVGQQEYYGVDKWWDRYIYDKEFRLHQEAQAHRAQYNFAKDKTKKPQMFLAALAKTMSGPMYGNMVEYRKALKLIKG